MGGKVLDEATSVPWRGGRKTKDIFVDMFPHLADEIVRWGSNGNNSIYMCMKHGLYLVFSYENKSLWKLETMECYKNGGRRILDSRKTD